jgi:hypothetical protein
MTRLRDRGRGSCSGREFSIVALLFALFVVAAACGKKGPPRAPELVMPEPITDLKAEVQPKVIALTWSRPTRYVGGKELRDLVGFVIFRKDVATSCPTCPAPYRELVSLGVEDQERFVKKKRFAFADRELSRDRIYYYRVFSQLRDGSLSEPSNEAQAVWRP